MNTEDPNKLSVLYDFVRNTRRETRGEVVVVAHGPELRAFARENHEKYQGIIDKMAELAQDGVQFKMRNNGKKAAGFSAEARRGFVTVVSAGFRKRRRPKNSAKERRMKWTHRLSVLMLAALPTAVQAGSGAPWGTAAEIEQVYRGQKVVFDTTTGTSAGIASVLDRASFLSMLNGADPFENRIVIVLHGQAIPYFAIRNYAKYKDLMQRAQSLTVGDVIEFRMCRAAARMQGLAPKDIHGFLKMVPMADAEIVRLQQEEGFAYMR